MKKILLLPFLLLIAMSAGAQCVASFTNAQVPVNNFLLRYQFSDNSTWGTLINKQYVTFNYTFGDGGYSNSSIAYHNYAAPGTYNVGLRIKKFDSTNVLLCTDTTTQTITVAYTPCGSVFTTSGQNSLTRTFTASTPAGTTGMSYSWNFGDGTSGSGSPVSHTYSTSGFYTVTLTATHSSAPSCSYTTSMGMYVWVLVCDSANAGFFFTQPSAKVVNIIPGGITWFPGMARTATFDYGDGTPATTSTTHTYATGGAFTIKQKVEWRDSVTNALICQDSALRQAYIYGTIFGAIYYDSINFSGTQTFNVYLIKYDSVTSMLRAVDTQSITGTGVVPYMFNGVLAGNYLVKAARLYSSASISGLVPTYHDSSLYWSTAKLIANNGNGFSWASIWMRNGAATTGPGFIGGNVSLGANKGSGAGIEGVTVLLRDGSNKLFASVLTDNAGDFTFKNVPVGSYSVYPEVVNYATTPASSINITAAAPTVNGLYFHQDDVKMNIMMHSLSTSTMSFAGFDIKLSPNPASQSVTLSWSGNKPGNTTVQITNATGQIVGRHYLNSNSIAGQQVLDISTLRSGLYFVRMISDVAGAPIKLVVQ